MAGLATPLPGRREPGTAGPMIIATRLLVILSVFAPLLAWWTTGSASAAWVAGFIGGATAYTARTAARSMRSDGRSRPPHSR